MDRTAHAPITCSDWGVERRSSRSRWLTAYSDARGHAEIAERVYGVPRPMRSELVLRALVLMDER